MSTMLATRTRKAIAAAVIVTSGLSIAACGTSDNGSTSSSSSSTKAAKPKPVASIDALQGKNTQITLDQGFVDALGQLKLTPGTVGDGKLANGALSFPITGGNVTVFKPGTVSPYVIGQIQHVGSGLSLTAGDTKVELTNFNVDPGVSRVYGDVSLNGKTVVQDAYLFRLNGSTLKPLQTQGSDAILEGTKVFISPVAAELLNKTFKTDAVTGDLLVGVAKITVNTQSAS
jgi:hypothetical protein